MPEQPYCIDCGDELVFDGEGEPPERCEECSTPMTGRGSAMLDRFASNLKDARHGIGLSVTALGNRAGFHTGYISTLERGWVEPGVITAVKVAAALGLPLDRLTSRIVWEPAEMAAPVGSVDQAAERLRGFFSVLPLDTPDDSLAIEATPTVEPTVEMEGSTGPEVVEIVKVETEQEAAKLFGENLLKLRERRGISQAKLARRSGLHTSHISLLEREGRSPWVETVVKLARGLEVHPRDFFAGIAWEAKELPPALKRETRKSDYDEIQRLWNAGAEVSRIAAAVGISERNVSTLVNRMREAGRMLAYRQPTRLLSQEVARMRRAEQISVEETLAVTEGTNGNGVGEGIDWDAREADEKAERKAASLAEGNAVAARIGGNVRWFREKSGRTQGEIAEAMETDRHYYAHIESGEYFANLALGTVIKLAAVLRVTQQALVEGIALDVERGRLVLSEF